MFARYLTQSRNYNDLDKEVAEAFALFSERNNTNEDDQLVFYEKQNSICRRNLCS